MPRRTWTDEQLRRAIDDAVTWADVLRALGLSTGGSSRRTLRRHAARLDLDVERLEIGGPPRRWTDEDLTEAVAASRTLHQVFVRLGLSVGGGTWLAMKQHIARLDLETSHWEGGSVRPEGTREPLPNWTDAEIADAFDGARSFAEVMRRLGLDPRRKRGQRALERRLVNLDLDRRALAGRRWSRGRTVPVAERRGRPLEDILVADSSYLNTHTLKRRLIDEGVLEARCARCEITTWCGQAAPLQLDHVNGDRTDNRPENLRLLCANCHALTGTYCGRNIGRR